MRPRTAAGRSAGKITSLLLSDFPSLAQRFHVPLAEQVDGRQFLVLDRNRHLLDGLPAGLGQHDLGFGVAARGFEPALGLQDGGLLVAVGAGHGGAALALGGSLLFHRVLHRCGRVDVLDLDGLQGDAPVGDVVGDGDLELRLDHVAGREGVVEIHLADDGTQRGLHQGADGQDVVLDAVDRFFRRDDVDVGDRVGDDDRVVVGDDLLRRDVEHDVLGGDLVGHGVDVGDHDVEPGPRVLWYLPSRCTTYLLPCGTSRTPLPRVTITSTRIAARTMMLSTRDLQSSR